MTENELTIQDVRASMERSEGMTRQQLELIKRTIAKGATDDELALFIQFCRSKKMDPFSRHLYAIKRQGVMTIQTGIDGFRAQAARNPHYAGQVGPFWCGPDGEWTDVWLKDEAPAAAKVGALRSDFKEPCWGVAHFDEYVQTYENRPVGLWKKMPRGMIAKCAEALALRKAFPDELSGIYATEEMDQAIDITPLSYIKRDGEPPSQPQGGQITSAAGAGQRDEKRSPTILASTPGAVPSRPAPAPVPLDADEGMDAQGSAPIEPARGESKEAAAGIPLPPIPLTPQASKEQRQALVKMANQVLGGRKEALAWLQQAGATSNLSVDLFKHLSKQLMDIDSANNANVESFDKTESQEPDIDF